MVLFVDGRPSEILPVSVTVLREYYQHQQTYTGVIPVKLPHSAVHPSSSDLMSRRYGLAVLCPEFVHALRDAIEHHREIFSMDPRGTLAYVEMFTEITVLLTSPGEIVNKPKSKERALQIIQEIKATTQVLSDAFEQRNTPGRVDPFAPNCKRLSSTFLPAPTLNGICIAFNALYAANDEMGRRCACCGIKLACTTSGECFSRPCKARSYCPVRLYLGFDFDTPVVSCRHVRALLRSFAYEGC